MMPKVALFDFASLPDFGIITPKKRVMMPKVALEY
jgi:hypothetical protein